MNEAPTIQCPACRANNEAGSRFCKACGIALPATRSDSAIQAPSGLRLKANRKCPGCGHSAAEDAVICTNCGYDWTTGRQVKTAPKKEAGNTLRRGLAQALQLAGKGIAVLVIAAISAWILYALWQDPRVRDLIQPPQPPAVAPAPASTNAPAVPKEPDWQLQHAQWAEVYATNFCPPASNSLVELRNLAGAPIRGQFLGVTNDMALILENGMVVGYARASLAPESRAKLFAADYAEPLAKEAVTRELKLWQAGQTNVAAGAPRAANVKKPVTIPCPLCAGSGFVMVLEESLTPGGQEARKPCPLCGGAGLRTLNLPPNSDICPGCQGMGRTLKGGRSRVYVKKALEAGIAPCARCDQAGFVENKYRSALERSATAPSAR